MYKVIKDFMGSPDGCRVLAYEKGQEYEISTNFSEDLRDVALTEGWVVEAEAKKPAKKAAKKEK